MKAGKRPKRHIAKPHRTWVYKWVDSETGRVDKSAPLEHHDFPFRWLQVAAVLFCSTDPGAKPEGERRLLQAAKIMAEWEAAKWSKKAVAKLDRPGRKDPLREKILTLMRSYRESDVKTLISAWLLEPLEGLRLSETPTGFVVSDENADENGDAGEKPYKLSTLTTMFSEAKVD